MNSMLVSCVIGTLLCRALVVLIALDHIAVLGL